MRLDRLFLAGALALPAARAAAVPPALPAIPKLEFKPRRAVSFSMPNGLKVYFVEDHSLPVVHLGALVRAGDRFDPPGKAGLAELLGMTLVSGGTRKYAPDELEREKEFLAIDLGAWMDLDRGGLSLTTLTRNLDKGFELFAEALRYPSFRSEKLETERQKLVEEIRRRNDEPMEAARREARRMYFGPDHPYGRRPEIETVQAVTRQDLLDYHVRYFLPNNVILTAAGDIGLEDLKARLDKAFGDWIHLDVKFPEIPPARAVEKREVYLYPKDVPQTSLRMIQRGPKPNDPDQYALDVMNDILGGGGFSTRLFGRVRSQKGLAYSVGTRFVELSDAGLFLAACGTKNETAALAGEEVLKNVEEMRSAPVSDEELGAAKDKIANSFVFRFDEPEEIASEAASLEYYGYPSDYLDVYLDRVRAVTKADVQRAARKWLAPDALVLVIIGDPKHFDRPAAVFGPVKEMKLD